MHTGIPAQVVIADTGTAPAAKALARIVARAGLWTCLETRTAALGVAPAELRILIKPDMGGFEIGSPSMTTPSLVEALLDLLFKAGYRNACIASAEDASAVWLDNRSPDIAADLLGYRYETPNGVPYEILNLAEDVETDVFPAASPLQGHPLSRAWREAHFRIVFAKNKTCQRNGYALCLQSLLDVFPAADKTYQYGGRIASGDAVAGLLKAVPVDFALIDALSSAHGSGASCAPRRLDTAVLIASPNPLLCDVVGAVKMGLDPLASPLVKGVVSAFGFPQRYEVFGNLAPYPGWQNVHPALLDSVQARTAWTGAERTVAPWVQSLNTQLFPFKNPIDERLNRVLAPALARLDEEPGSLSALTFSNYALAWLHQALLVYRIHFDKDSLRRVDMPINLDFAALSPADFDGVAASAKAWLPLIQGAPNTGAHGLQWRYLDGAVVFEVSQTLPVAFDEFVASFDIARSIEFMNDYIGGHTHAVTRDARGRIIHQVERNLYLPQPNYIAAYGGTVIDVTKLETVEYGPDAQHMWWKTVHSANESARYDDGVVTVARTADGAGTALKIAARQQFALPPAIEAWRLELVPALKNALVTHAYETFAQRTFANFVAVTEGRDPRIGQPWAPPDSVEERAVDLVLRQIDRARAGEGQFGWITKMLDGPAKAAAARGGGIADADGFIHFETAPAAEPDGASALAEIGSFWRGLAAAIQRDARP